MNNDLDLQEALCNWALGLSGEVGEVVEHVKKHCFHGKSLNYDEVEKEIGDVLWYVSALCTELGFNLDEVAQKNISKLMARYPEGFEKKNPKNVIKKSMRDIFDFVGDDDDSAAVASHVRDQPTSEYEGEDDHQSKRLNVVPPIRKLDVWQIPTEQD